VSAPHANSSADPLPPYPAWSLPESPSAAASPCTASAPASSPPRPIRPSHTAATANFIPRRRIAATSGVPRYRYEHRESNAQQLARFARGANPMRRLERLVLNRPKKGTLRRNARRSVPGDFHLTAEAYSIAVATSRPHHHLTFACSLVETTPSVVGTKTQGAGTCFGMWRLPSDLVGTWLLRQSYRGDAAVPGGTEAAVGRIVAAPFRAGAFCRWRASACTRERSLGEFGCFVL
jgi:hypothetical protein